MVIDMKYFIPALLLLLTFPDFAFAQQAGPPSEQALAIKLSNEISLGLQCSAGLITVQQELANAKAKIKELEAKAAPAAKD